MKKNGFQRAMAAIALFGMALILVFAGCKEEAPKKEPDKKKEPIVTSITIERPISPGFAYAGEGGELTYNITVEGENISTASPINLVGNNNVIIGELIDNAVKPIAGVSIKEGTIISTGTHQFVIAIDDSFEDAQTLYLALSINRVPSNEFPLFISPESLAESVEVLLADVPNNEVFAGTKKTIEYTITVKGDPAGFPINIRNDIIFKLNNGEELPVGIDVLAGSITTSEVAVPLKFEVDIPAGFPDTYHIVANVHTRNSNVFALEVKPCDLFGEVTVSGFINPANEEEELLTVHTDNLPGNGQLHYKWQRGDSIGGVFTDIDGAENKNTYDTVQADWTRYVRVLVSRAGFTPESFVIGGPHYVEDPRLPEIAGTVTISGNFELGTVLTANAAITAPTGINESDLQYQWVHGNSADGAISGFNSKTFTVRELDIDQVLNVYVFTLQKSRGHILSTSTTVVKPHMTGSVQITGNPQIGHTLYVDTSALTGEGILEYEWQRQALPGTFEVLGRQSIYVVEDTDYGEKIRVKVTRVGYTGEAISDWTGTVYRFPPLTGTVTIEGEPYATWSLYADIWSLDGFGTPTFVWERGTSGVFTEISGANAQIYVMQSEDVGKTIRVKVSRAGFEGEKIGGPTAVVQPQPSVSGKPVITGAAEVGARLVVDISNVTGTGSPTYVWERKLVVEEGEPEDGEPEDGEENGGEDTEEFTVIAGATGNVYVVPRKDAGYLIRVKVTRAAYLGEAISDPTDKISDATFLTVTQQLTALRAISPAPATYSLILADDTEALTAQTLTFATPIEITLSGIQGSYLTLTPNNASMFTINNNVTLVLENIELRGKSSNQNAPLVNIAPGGALIMNNGSSIKNNISTGATGGGVRTQYSTTVGDGYLVMNEGSTISGNRATQGGGVHNSGVIAMIGGAITGNSVTGTGTSGRGGGVYNAGELYISGGSIDTNTASTLGGGVYNAWYIGLGGGKISNNTASQHGGGIYSIDNQVEILGGEISGNTATQNGGGVALYGGTMYMEDGKISGNKQTSASYDGGGVYVYQGNNYVGELIMIGGEISGNTAARYGGGVMLYNVNAYFSMYNGIISGNTAQGGGGISNFVGKHYVMNAAIYGSDAEAGLRNISTVTANPAAVHLLSGTSGGQTLNPTSQRGIFVQEGQSMVFEQMGNLLASNTTVIIQNGVNTTAPTGLKVTGIDPKFAGMEGRIFLSTNAGVSWVRLTGADAEIQIPDTTFTWPIWDLTTSNWPIKIEFHNGGELEAAYSGNIPLGAGITTTAFTNFTALELGGLITSITITGMPSEHIGKLVDLNYPTGTQWSEIEWDVPLT